MLPLSETLEKSIRYLRENVEKYSKMENYPDGIDIQNVMIKMW